MSNALVSGSADRAERVARLLEAADVTTRTVTEHAVTGEDRGEQLDYYIQLPATVQAEGETAVARVGSFLAAGLLGRFAAVDALLPTLAAGAVVVLVSGNTPDEVMLPDDQRSRLALLHLLAHATRAEVGPRSVRVEVVSAGRSDVEIVEYAVRGRPDRAAPRRSPADQDYRDWRTEVMGLAGVDV